MTRLPFYEHKVKRGEGTNPFRECAGLKLCAGLVGELEYRFLLASLTHALGRNRANLIEGHPKEELRRAHD